MSSRAFIREDISRDVTPHRTQIWYGFFSQDVASLTDLATVVVPDYDGNIHWPNCRWQSRDAVTMPNQGDECIIVFDNRNQPWIIAWWPA